MKMKSKAFNKLDVYESEFYNELENNEVKLLRDIRVTKDRLIEIADSIRVLLLTDETFTLRRKYPLTTSLFLVWTAIYNYKDGDFWSVIFASLRLSSTSRYQRILGEIFLYTISKYDLLTIERSDGKKYLSPILMHGYISNHYAFALFDYLNKVYSILLNYDVSEANIESIWNDFFIENISNDQIAERISKIESMIENLVDERSEYNIPNHLISISRTDVKEQEVIVSDLYESITNDEVEIDEYTSKLKEFKNILNYLLAFDSSITNLSRIPSDIVQNGSLIKLSKLTLDIEKEITDSINKLELEIKKIRKRIKATSNKLAIEEEKVKQINMDISTLGQGDLEEGWYKIERANEIDQELNELYQQLVEKKKLMELTQRIQNTSLKQILTSSLNHLFREDHEHFKEFIIETFQAIDTIYKGAEIDNDYPLHDIVTQWSKEFNTSYIIPPSKLYNDRQRSQDNNKEDYKDDNNDNRTNRASLDGNSNSFRLQLQGLSKPKIRLDTTTWDILLYIPEQRLPYNSIFNQSPRYILESNYEDELDLQTYKNGNEIFIKELSIPIYDYIEHNFKFEYAYLREEFILELDTIMIFNEKGELESGTRLNNGNYYVVCNNEWNSAFDGIVYVYPSNLEGFNIYELQLREDKAVFKSSNNEVVEYIGSNVSLLVLNDYCLVEGVTLDGIKVSNGGLPTILINLCDVNISDTRITVYLNDNITFNKSLEELLDLDYIEKEDLLISVGLNYLLGQNPQVKKVKILLKDYSGNIIFLEEFWSITGTSFTYNNNYLDVKFSSWKRIEYKDQRQNAKRFSIPLLDKPGEIFSVFYKKAGWKHFNIEVPNITYSFVDKDGNRVEIPKDLLVSQLHILKDTYISWEVESKIPKAINVFDYDRNLETRLHFKKGTATLNLYSYYDTLKSTDSNTSLSFVWLAGNRYSQAETILRVFKKWEVSEIECYSKEEDDEYIVELKYQSNFDLQADKFIRLVNDDKLIFEKSLKDNETIIYIKKKDLISLNVSIQIGYKEEFDDIFGKTINETIAGQYSLKLTSRLYNLSLIKEHGVKATSFKYKGKSYRFMSPFLITNIEKTEPRNFIQEELYLGQALIGDKCTEVLFYINADSNTIPFLLDIDRDGAQYDPNTGDVFWENRKGKYIMGPLDDIIYVIGEE